MVAVNARDMARRFAKADQVPPVVVVHGTDHGLVAETAAALVALAGEGGDDPFAMVRLGPDELSADEGRIVDEARTISLFGGKRTIWVRGAAERAVSVALAALIEEPPVDAVVIVELGDLKKSSPLRKAAEASRDAAAIVCYADGERDLERLFDTLAQEVGLAAEPEARDLALSLLGGDRAASRSELEKLFLYARGGGRVTVDHVRAIVGDVAEHRSTDVVDAAFLGRVAEVGRQLDVLASAATNAGTIAGQALRWAEALERARLDVDRGAAAARVVDRMIPPVIFFRKPDVTRMLSIWDAGRLRRVAEDFAEAVLATRRQPHTARSVVEIALLRTATLAKRLAG